MSLISQDKEKGTFLFAIEGKHRPDLTEKLGQMMGRSTYFEVHELLDSTNNYGGFMLVTSPKFYGKKKGMVIALETNVHEDDVDMVIDKWIGFLLEFADM